MRDLNYSEEIVIASNQYIKEKEYWQNQLEGEWSVCAFPADNHVKNLRKPKPKPGKVTFEFTGDLFVKLMKLSKTSDPRLHMSLVTGVAILLYKYTGNTDIIIGTTIDKQETEGQFLNTLLPLRSQLTGSMTFKELLLKVRDTIFAAIEHQNYPIETLANEWSRGGEAVDIEENGFPLFDVMALLENIHDKRYLRGITPGMTFIFSRTNHCIEAVVEYQSQRYHETAVKKIAAHYLVVMKQALSNPDVKLADIELLSSETRRQLLVDYNHTAADYPQDKMLHQLFEEQVPRTPARTAVVNRKPGIGEENLHLTYSELNQKSDRLAHLLKEKGVTPGTIVAIMMERSADIIIGILGILKAGGAYLPIALDYPEERRNYILADAKVKYLVKKSNNFEDIPQLEKTGQQVAALKKQSPALFPQRVSVPGNLAYVIYTSGSTGQPKGVMVNHQAVVNYLWWAVKHYVKDEKINFPLFTSIAFDLTITSLFTPLVTGNAVVIYHEEDNPDLMLIEKILKERRVEAIKLTPSHLRLLNDKEIRVKGTTIKRIIVGGEEFDNTLAKETSEIFGGAIEIFNEYGPTEATVGCMIYKFSSRENKRKSVPLGRPVDNTRVYLVDEDKNPVPIGGFGELYVSGDGLARGYLNNPELTAEKFCLRRPGGSFCKNRPLDPHKNFLLEGTRGLAPLLYAPLFYRTGDRARWISRDNIEFSGRIDNQVKIRGLRIEPGEIESRLLTHPTVKEAAVMVKEGRFLWAYLVPRSGEVLNTGDIQEYLQRYLPLYMIPVRFLELQQIPLAPNGKKNRKELEKYDKSALMETKYLPPRTETEKKLLKILQNILKLEKISIKDNFFNIGGDSILAIRFFNLINQQFAVDLKIADLYSHETLEQLAEIIEQNQDKTKPTQTEKKVNKAVKKIEALKSKIMENQ